MSLRVGIFLDALAVPRWHARVVWDLLKDADLEVSVHAGTGAIPRSEGGWFFRWYDRMDRKTFGQKDDALEVVSLTVPETAQGAAEGLDVALWLRDAPVPDDLAARCGVWTFRFGEGGEPIAYWETMRVEGVVYSALENVRDNTVVYESWAPVERVARHRSVHNVLCKTALFPGRALRALGDDRLDPKPARARRSRGGPGSLRTAGHLFRHAWRYALSKIDHWRGPPQWYIGVTRNPAVGWDQLKMEAALRPPREEFWADPFLIARDGRHFVYVEVLPYATERGYLAVLEVDGNNEIVSRKTVLEKPFHLSYPFLFEHAGELWMIPETSADKKVVLYRCAEFPDRFVEHKVLLDGVNAVDTTLQFHDGTWWMFVNVAAPGVLWNWDELCVYYADSPEGPWTPHPANPVVSDCRVARPAGKILEKDGALYRPAQNCTPDYGTSTVIRRIDTLTKTDYTETTVAEFRPEPSGARRTHTLNVAGGMGVVDLLNRRR